MTDQPATNQLEFGEDLGLLRFALPPLGLLMAGAGIGGWFIGQVKPLAAAVIAALGLAATIWSLRMTTRRIAFDASTRKVHIRMRQGRQRSEHILRFEQVQDVVLRILEGYRRGTDSPLGRLMSWQLILVTDAGEFPLSRLAEQTLQDCEAKDRSIWQILGRTPPESLLARSYRYAVQHRDRLQAIWLARLITPQASLSEAEAQVQRDLPTP
jgi:hypothetical protein